MSFYKTILRTLLLACFFCFSFTHSQNSRPNIMVILADDMGIDVTNGYQSNPIMPTTPTLDSLRANGITYKNNWATPSCSPSRAAIISGEYGIKTGVMAVGGVLDPVEHTSFFNALSNGTNDAYSKAAFGKWHIADRNDVSQPEQHGVDHYEGLFNGTLNNYSNWQKVKNGVTSTVTEYLTTHLTDAAIDWLDDQNEDEPWLLWLAHTAPHIPFHVPPAGLFSIDDTSTDLNKYIAAIEAMDHEIGRLLHNLDEETKKNTLVVFIGDNGTPGQVSQFFERSHSKGSLYEGGVRVPMIVSGKGVTRINEEEEGLTHVMDLHATILEVAGVQLKGGINNSLSIKPSFNCTDQIKRVYNYTDYRDRNTGLEWAIRTNQYKLIENENGVQEFFDITVDLAEQNNLLGSLTTEQQVIFSELSAEANTIRTGWSCNDGISNGDETEIDDCDVDCSNSNVTNATNIGCCASPMAPNAFFEYVKDGDRTIYSNNFPNHDYCFSSPTQMPAQKYQSFAMDLTPEVTGSITPLVSANGRPERFFGVANNGVIMSPSPVEPFIFKNPNTGDLNWDWVFEPTNNQGDGADLVGLDCSSGYTGPEGYHYKGNMFQYLETVSPGSTTADQVPNEVIHIGWAADGFPILYRFGPDQDGTVKELLPSYQFKRGERPGDGITAPCGEYNGKYTKDYEYICGKGDLDECNGISAPVTLATTAGNETFSYYYVVTSSFPQISRCLVGSVSADFDTSATQPTGNDNDNDGFIAAFDCDDNDASVNPSVDGKSPVLDNCNILSTTNYALKDHFKIGPNPSNGDLTIISLENKTFNAKVYDLNSRLIYNETANSKLELTQLSAGFYIVKVKDEINREMTRKVIVK